MSMSANRQTAIRLLKSVLSGPPSLDDVAPGATWWVPGRPAVPMVPFLENLGSIFPSGGTMKIEGVIEDGDRLAIEATSSVPFEDGRHYANVYHFLVEMRDGKVAVVKEYCDTALVQAFFSSAAKA